MALLISRAMDWNEVVAGNIRRLRLARGMSQEELAGEAELALRHLGRIERVENSPTVMTLARVSKALGVEPAALFARPKPNLGVPSSN